MELGTESRGRRRRKKRKEEECIIKFVLTENIQLQCPDKSSKLNLHSNSEIHFDAPP